MEKVPMTPQGHSKLQAELKNLKEVERPEIIEAIAVARDHGDLKENAEYHSAREKQGFIEGRIQELEAVLSRAEVIDYNKFDGDTIRFGATVKIYDEDADKDLTYQVVGHYEANIENGKLSIQAPLARAIIGKAEGDVVTVQTPGGKKDYEIVSVSYTA